jgi:hypothetical protein
MPPARAFGFQTINPGAPVELVFDNDPGRVHHGTILDIPLGVGQGQVGAAICEFSRTCEFV